MQALMRTIKAYSKGAPFYCALTNPLPDLNSRSHDKALFVDLLRGRQLT